MIKVLFLIHDLGQGGAEKVLVNLVNNLDKNKFNITVISLFGGGVNEQFLSKDINYKVIFKKSFPGNSYFLKLFSRRFLHRWFVKDTYDIEISYLEGPSARIVSGCKNNKTKTVSWIHIEQKNKKEASKSFLGYKEACKCYESFDQTIAVSNYVKKNFNGIFPRVQNIDVLYNTVLSEKIVALSKSKIDIRFDNSFSNLIAVGSLKKGKGYERLLNCCSKLINEGIKTRLYILGKGPEKIKLLDKVKLLGIENDVFFLGYDTNPYKYVSKADLFVCASYAEGFSTAVTESLIVGTPVITTRVSGMDELLGVNEYGLIVDNDDEALHKGLKYFLSNPDVLKHYRERALERGKEFNTEKTVKAVEKMFEDLIFKTN